MKPHKNSQVYFFLLALNVFIKNLQSNMLSGASTESLNQVSDIYRMAMMFVYKYTTLRKILWPNMFFPIWGTQAIYGGD